MQCSDNQRGKDTVFQLGYNQGTNAVTQREALMNRQIRILVLMASSMCPALVFAWGDESYDACILQYQKEAKSNYATHLIQEACTKLHKEGDFLFSDEKVYYQCLLDNVPGVENDRALESIRQACRSRSQD